MLKKSILLFLGGGLLGFVLLELIARAFFVRTDQIDTWSFNPSGYGDLAAGKNFVSMESPDLPYRVITNDAGLRNDKQLSLVKNKDTFRILTVGDSFTFGTYVNNHDTYPEKLAYYLNKKQSKSIFEVFNAGVPGYTLVDELEYLEEKGLALQPDLVIVGVFENDVADYNPRSRAIFSRQSLKEKTRMLPVLYQLAKKSALATLIDTVVRNQRLKKIRETATPAVSTQELQKELEAYFADLERMIELLKRKKTEVLFVLIPAYYQLTASDYPPQNRIKEKIGDVFPTIDLLPEFKKIANPEMLYLLPQNAHLSSYGNAFVAEILAREIIRLTNTKKIPK